MSDMTLTKTRIRAGIWEGVLQSGDAAPEIQVRHLEQVLTGATVRAVDGSAGAYAVQVPIPSKLLNDGVQTFVIQNAATGDTLASFAVVAGRPLDEDLRAEIDLLRAELDLLKRAFRRHCVETS